MYNRYVPGHDGNYRRQMIPDASELRCPPPENPVKEACCEQETEIAQQQKSIRSTGFSGFDLGDLLLLCIVILLWIDAKEEDTLPLLITAAAFLLLQ